MSATVAVTEGEAANLRERLTTVERKAAEGLERIAVHEQKCASRYLQILALLAISILMNAPAALPHIGMLLGLLPK